MADEPISLRNILGEELYDRLLKAGCFDPNRKFKPFATYFPHLDMLLMQERDCSTVSDWANGSAVEVLTDFDGKRVGVQIFCFSKLVPKEVIDAFIASDLILGGTPRT